VQQRGGEILGLLEGGVRRNLRDVRVGPEVKDGKAVGGQGAGPRPGPEPGKAEAGRFLRDA
jgi:hypothetical protein